MNRPTEVEPTHVAHSGHSTVQPYTPAMMAQMLGISVRAIRSWYRAGLLEPSRVVMKIPYFDYTEMAKAKTFAQWMRQGLTAQVIVRQLTALNRLRSGVAEPAACLPIRLEGKRLVLRQGGLQVEASGQIQFGFEVDGDAELNEPVTIKFSPATPAADDDHSLAAMLEAALEAEDNDDLDTATQWYRSILGRYGPDADICFQLAELLYRQADLSALASGTSWRSNWNPAWSRPVPIWAACWPSADGCSGPWPPSKVPCNNTRLCGCPLPPGPHAG